jgi:predicted PhzF superfamily epimerase YddE/YHI9
MPTARRRNARGRFFTPRQEIGACGHVAVAIATALAEAGVWPMGAAAASAAGGRYPLYPSDSGADQVRMEMRQRLRHLDQPGQVPDLDGVLGPVQLSRRLPVTIAGTGLRHLLIPVQDAAGRSLPPQPGGPIAVQRRVSSRGGLMVACQKIHAGMIHAGKTATVICENTHFRVIIDGETAAVVPRTTTSEVRRYKANATDKRTQPRLTPEGR